jgi:hypothetical protein
MQFRHACRGYKTTSGLFETILKVIWTLTNGYFDTIVTFLNNIAYFRYICGWIDQEKSTIH